MKNSLLILLFIGSNAIAQTQYIYGPQGQYIGQAITSNNTTYLYGDQGQSAGQIVRQAAPLTMPIPLNVIPINTLNPLSMTPIYDSIFGK